MSDKQVQGFGELMRVQGHEVATTGQAETAKALVQARFIMAHQCPRSFDQVRNELLEACRRPRFAEVAQYSKPQGGAQVRGASIRFADEAVKIMGNIDTRQDVVFEDDEKRIVQVSVTDLEKNITKNDSVTVHKTVERKNPKAGAEILRARENTSGDKVYVVRATDDEVIMKQANLCAKCRRNLELQMIPQDIVEECCDAINNTLRNRDAEDPKAAYKKILDAFAAVKVTPKRLESYLGHPVSECSPAELGDLRNIYRSIKSGDATMNEYEAAKEEAAIEAEGTTAGESGEHYSQRNEDDQVATAEMIDELKALKRKRCMPQEVRDGVNLLIQTGKMTVAQYRKNRDAMQEIVEKAEAETATTPPPAPEPAPASAPVVVQDPEDDDLDMGDDAPVETVPLAPEPEPKPEAPKSNIIVPDWAKPIIDAGVPPERLMAYCLAERMMREGQGLTHVRLTAQMGIAATPIAQLKEHMKEVLG